MFRQRQRSIAAGNDFSTAFKKMFYLLLAEICAEKFFIDILLSIRDDQNVDMMQRTVVQMSSGQKIQINFRRVVQFHELFGVADCDFC